MPASRRTRRNRNDNRDEQVRHHLEEISTHIGAIKQLTPKYDKFWDQVGQRLIKIYVRHGGNPFA